MSHTASIAYQITCVSLLRKNWTMHDVAAKMARQSVASIIVDISQAYIKRGHTPIQVLPVPNAYTIHDILTTKHLKKTLVTCINSVQLSA